MAKARSSPTFSEPMAARLVDKLPEGPEWLYELKFDGYRALLIKDGAEVRVVSRNQKDLTRAYPTVVVAAQRVTARQAVIDGEIIAHDAQGQPSFQALQHTTAPRTIVFYAGSPDDWERLTGKGPISAKDWPRVYNEPTLETTSGRPGKIVENSMVAGAGFAMFAAAAATPRSVRVK